MEQAIPEKFMRYLGLETKPNNFGDFWSEKIEEVKQAELNFHLELQEKIVFIGKKIFKVRLKALDGTDIIGWHICSEKKQKHCLLTTHGYRSKKGYPYEYLHWVDSGVDVLAFDMRLQGGETGCKTPLLGPLSEVIALNILNLQKCYLLLMYQDMLLASRLPTHLGYEGYILEGTSQAGGLAVATACLMQTAIAVMVNVPSNSDLDERVKNSKGSFKAFQSLCNQNAESYEKVLYHLSYFDTKNMADRLNAPLFASVGGLDTVCPAQAFFATYNRVKTSKEITYYPFSGHEGGGGLHTEKEITFLHSLIEKKSG